MAFNPASFAQAKGIRVRRVIAALAATLCLGGASAVAQTDEFYKGKTLVILIPTGPGGNYDFAGRLMARYLPAQIPGSPSIIVQNMPGGGGMTMSNHLYNVAAKDGSVIGMVYQTAGLDQALGPQARYDFGEFGWIGRIASSTSLVMLHESAPVQTLEGMREKEVVFGSPGKSSQSTFVPVLMRTVLGYKTRVIFGYKGAADMFLAMERGEIQGRTGSMDSINAVQPNWIRDGRAKIVAELSLEPKPTIEGVPLMRDLAKTQEDRDILDFMASYTAFGVAFAAPPKIPAERLAMLRKAFATAVKESELRADLERGQFAYSPESGERLQELARKFASASPDLIARVKVAIEEGKE